MQRQAPPAVLIQQGQDPDARPVLRLVLHKVPAPHFVRPRGPAPLRRRFSQPPHPPLLVLDLQAGKASRSSGLRPAGSWGTWRRCPALGVSTTLADARSGSITSPAQGAQDPLLVEKYRCFS